MDELLKKQKVFFDEMQEETKQLLLAQDKKFKIFQEEIEAELKKFKVSFEEISGKTIEETLDEKEEPFKNYGSIEEPLYYKREIRDKCKIPRNTLSDFTTKNFDKNDTVNKNTILEFKDKKGKIKNQIRTIDLLTTSGLTKVLSKTYRTIIPQHILDFYKISTLNRLNCEESKWLTSIQETFNQETILFQYAVDSYRLDAYLPKYNLVIEVDENNHVGYDVEKENKRKEILFKKLNNPTIIRFNPYDKNVTIFQILNKINAVINA